MPRPPTNKTPHSLCIYVSIDGIKACLSSCETLTDKVRADSIDEIRKFETKDIPLVCGGCEDVVTESNPIELKMLHTEEIINGKRVYLPDLWIAKCCMPFDETNFLEKNMLNYVNNLRKKGITIPFFLFIINLLLFIIIYLLLFLYFTIIIMNNQSLIARVFSGSCHR